MRRALLPWLVLIVALALLCRQVTMPPAVAPISGQVGAYRPWTYADESGVSVVCISNRSAVIYPPIFHVVPATLAPVVPNPASSYTPPAVWGGP